MVINAKIRSCKNLKMKKTQNFMTHLLPDLQYMLESDILRNSSQILLVVLKCDFWVFGCPNDPPDTLLAKTLCGILTVASVAASAIAVAAATQGALLSNSYLPITSGPGFSHH